MKCAPPVPLAGFKGPTSKGRERRGQGREGKGRVWEGRGKEGRVGEGTEGKEDSKRSSSSKFSTTQLNRKSYIVYIAGVSNATGYEKNRDFPPISRFISEMMQVRAIVTIEGIQWPTNKKSYMVYQTAPF